jgi:hypothetical protein
MRASRLLHGTATAQRFTPPISSLRSPDQLHLQGHGTTELYRLGLLIPSWVFRMLTACLQGTMGPECFDCQCEVHPRKAHPQDPREAHPQVSAIQGRHAARFFTNSRIDIIFAKRFSECGASTGAVLAPTFGPSPDICHAVLP